MSFLFEWDDKKDHENRIKHGVSFYEAQKAFLDPCRVTAKDVGHSHKEERYFCFRKGGFWHYDCSIYVSKTYDSDYWCWLLAKRKENL